MFDKASYVKLYVNLIRAVVFGVSHYLFQFLKANTNHHDHVARGTLLFWTRDIVLLCIMYHLTIMFDLLSSSSSSETISINNTRTLSYTNVAEQYVWTMTKDRSDVHTSATLVYETITSLLFVILIVRSVSWTILCGQQKATSTMHRFIWKNKLQHTALSCQLQQWWKQQQDKQQPKDRLLINMPPALRHAVAHHTWVQHLETVFEFSTSTSLSLSFIVRQKLAKTMYSTTYLCNQTIVEQNETLKTLHYLSTGRISIGERNNPWQPDQHQPQYQSPATLVQPARWFSFEAIAYVCGATPWCAAATLLALDNGTTVLRLDGDVLYHYLFLSHPDVLDALRLHIATWQQRDGKFRLEQQRQYEEQQHRQRQRQQQPHGNKTHRNHRNFRNRKAKKSKHGRRRRSRRRYDSDSSSSSSSSSSSEDDTNGASNAALTREEKNNILNGLEDQHRSKQNLRVSFDERLHTAAHDDRIREWPSSEPIVRVKLYGPTIASHLKGRTGTRGAWCEPEGPSPSLPLGKMGRYSVVLDGKSKGRAAMQVKVLPQDLVILNISGPRDTPETAETFDHSLASWQTSNTPDSTMHPAQQYRHDRDLEERKSEDEFDAFPSNERPESRALLGKFLKEPESAAVSYKDHSTSDSFGHEHVEMYGGGSNSHREPDVNVGGEGKDGEGWA
jgi:hypothetical protein